MAFTPPAVSLPPARGSLYAPTSDSGALLIRAPLSSDSPTASDSSEFEFDDEGFLTASDPEEESFPVSSSLRPAAAAVSADRGGAFLPRSGPMPVAQLTGDDEDEVFDDGLADEEVGGGAGFSLAARVVPLDQDPIMAEKGEVVDPSAGLGLAAPVDGGNSSDSKGDLGDGQNLSERAKDKHLGAMEEVGSQTGAAGGAATGGMADKTDGTLNGGWEEKAAGQREVLVPNIGSSVSIHVPSLVAMDINELSEPNLGAGGGSEDGEEFGGGEAEKEDNFNGSFELAAGNPVDSPLIGEKSSQRQAAADSETEHIKSKPELTNGGAGTESRAVERTIVEESVIFEGRDDGENAENLEARHSGDVSLADAGYEDRRQNEVELDDDDDDFISKRSARQLMKELDEVESFTTRDYSNEVDGCVVLDSDEELDNGEDLEAKHSGDVSLADAGYEDCRQDEIELDDDEDEDEDFISKRSAKQLMKELDEVESFTTRDYSNEVDGRFILDSNEELDNGEESDEKHMFGSDGLVAFLEAASGAVTSQDGSSRIFLVDPLAGLGSSDTSTWPSPFRLAQPSDLAKNADPEKEMTNEEKKLHDKIESIRVKFLRLVHRLRLSPEDKVAAEVLDELGLVEQLRRGGRRTDGVFSLDNAKKKALQLETEGVEDLNFSCNILVLGKTGVGKSATINSIFGETKSQTNAFELATDSVREVIGTVDGVKLHIIDTPGLRTSLIDQARNMKILLSIKKKMKRFRPDIVIYFDRMDALIGDSNDLPLLRSIASVLGSSIWSDSRTIIALTHAASTPPEGPSGAVLNYEVLVAWRSRILQQAIQRAAQDYSITNRVALVENHPSCSKNREGEMVLPNSVIWRSKLLLLCYSLKIRSEAKSLLKLQNASPTKRVGFRLLPYLLSSLLQSKAHPRLSSDQNIENVDSNIDLDDLSAADDEEEDEYDHLPPFKPLRKSQIAKLTKKQRKAYFDEYDYRIKLLQKKQWKEELRRLKEMKRGSTDQDGFGGGGQPEDYDQDNGPASVAVLLPDMALPPSFDCDNPTYRYRFLEAAACHQARPVLVSEGWDHDCGYDGVSLEENLAAAGQFPAEVAVQVTKGKNEFSIHLDSSIAAKHGKHSSTLAGFNVQTLGKQVAYTLCGETKFKNWNKNRTAGGISVTFVGDTMATGVKLEDQLSIGKRVALVASTGAIRAEARTACGANFEARLREDDYLAGQAVLTLGLSLMRWSRDLAINANLESQHSVGRSSKMSVRVGLNDKLSGQIAIKISTSEQLQIALMGILPIAISMFKSMWPGAG